MKSRQTFRFSPQGISPRTAVATLVLGAAPALHAASDSWIAGTDGDYSTPANWTGGNVPNGAADVASSDDTGSVINFGASDNITLSRLDLNIASGATIFNQSGGALSIGTLGFGGGGGSRNPTYNLSNGTLNIATAFAWGNGSNARFNITGGIVNQSAGTLNLGVNGGANGAIVMSGGTFNHTAAAQVGFGTGGTGIGALTMSGGTFNANSATTIRISNASGGSGSITLSNAAAFSATAAPTVYLGNNSGVGTLALSGTSSFNVSAAAISVGQFGTGSGTVTLADSATLTAARLVLGGDNAGSAVTGIVNLNGGTINAGAIQLGASSVTPSATANVLHADGGTIRATAHPANANFFGRNNDQTPGAPTTAGLYVDLLAGGLNLDTDGNNITITEGTTMAGSGGLAKKGAGSLTILGAKTYTGATVVEAGTLNLGAGSELAGAVTVNGGATLAGRGTIHGSVAIAGMHSVGASPGLQTFTNGLEYLATGALNWELVANTTGGRGLATGYDAIDVTGGVLTVDGSATINLAFNAAGSTVDFTDGFWTSDQSWLVIELGDSASGGSSDTFTLGSVGLDANGVAATAFGTFSMSNTGGNHYLVWTAVPEPASALLGSLGLLLVLRRRRFAA